MIYLENQKSKIVLEKKLKDLLGYLKKNDKIWKFL